MVGRGRKGGGGGGRTQVQRRVLVHVLHIDVASVCQKRMHCRHPREERAGVMGARERTDRGVASTCCQVQSCASTVVRHVHVHARLGQHLLHWRWRARRSALEWMRMRI
jgi:hypothetical protein